MKKNQKNKLLTNMKEAITSHLDNDRDSNVNQTLVSLIQKGLVPFCQNGPVMTMRRLIQDDPLVVKALALRLKELKKIFEHFLKQGHFKFNYSALRMFEMKDMTMLSKTEVDHFWYPLSVIDLW